MGYDVTTIDYSHKNSQNGSTVATWAARFYTEAAFSFEWQFIKFENYNKFELFFFRNKKMNATRWFGHKIYGLKKPLLYEVDGKLNFKSSQFIAPKQQLRIGYSKEYAEKYKLPLHSYLISWTYLWRFNHFSESSWSSISTNRLILRSKTKRINTSIAFLPSFLPWTAFSMEFISTTSIFVRFSDLSALAPTANEMTNYPNTLSVEPFGGFHNFSAFVHTFLRVHIYPKQHLEIFECSGPITSI